jgi:hypothetical protein
LSEYFNITKNENNEIKINNYDNFKTNDINFYNTILTLKKLNIITNIINTNTLIKNNLKKKLTLKSELKMLTLKNIQLKQYILLIFAEYLENIKKLTSLNDKKTKSNVLKELKLLIKSIIELKNTIIVINNRIKLIKKKYISTIIYLNKKSIKNINFEKIKNVKQKDKIRIYNYILNLLIQNVIISKQNRKTNNHELELLSYLKIYLNKKIIQNYVINNLIGDNLNLALDTDTIFDSNNLTNLIKIFSYSNFINKKFNIGINKKKILINILNYNYNVLRGLKLNYNIKVSIKKAIIRYIIFTNKLLLNIVVNKKYKLKNTYI